MINLIFWSGHTHGTGLDGGADPVLGSGRSSCSCTWGAQWGWGSWVPAGSLWLRSSLGGKNRAFGSFSCWKEVAGGHCHAPEPLHACALPPTCMHVGLCQMCPHVLTYRCWHMRVCTFTHPCLRGHTHAHCTVMSLHRHPALHTHVPPWPCAHPAVHTSVWSHAQSRTCTRM